MARKKRKSPVKKKKRAPVRRRLPVLALAGGGVRVRMYRQGLGDCFLLTFSVDGGERHVLIDCGTLGATTTGVKIADVVKNIRETTNGRLHLLVATHEHSDHVIGFLRQDEAFKAMDIERVWVAWTENPNDEVAKDLGSVEDLRATLRAAATALAQPSVADPAARDAGLAIDSLLGFAESVDEAMKVVTQGLGVEPDYLKPGDGRLEEDWLPGFRVFVLGPPRNSEVLMDMGGHGSSELYGMAGMRLGAAQRNLAALAALDAEAKPPSSEMLEEIERAMPFDWRFRVDPQHESVRTSYRSYQSEADSWRRIDHDWLMSASDLALQFDKFINNTSLVLAFERIADGKVLFFVADAQQGNWLSWEPLRWTVEEGGASKIVSAADLMRRTVFYKVGHHASHNATAKGRGLELMESDELVAMIPVDRAVALTRNPQGSWKMPARALYRRLLEKSNGRVVRSDLGWAADSADAANRDVEEEFDGLATKAEWTKWATAQQQAAVTIGPLFIDFVLAPADD